MYNIKIPEQKQPNTKTLKNAYDCFPPFFKGAVKKIIMEVSYPNGIGCMVKDDRGKWHNLTDISSGKGVAQKSEYYFIHTAARSLKLSSIYLMATLTADTC